MEIREYLRLMGARKWLLLAVPLLAVAIGVLAVSRQPIRYETVGTAVVPSLFDSSAPQASLQSVASFQSAVVSQSIVERVSAETGVTQRRVAAGLGTRQVGSTDVVEVVWTSTRREGPEAVITAAVDQTLRLLLRGRLASAEHAVASAQDGYDAAKQSLRDFQQETGLLIPEADYRAVATELAGYRVEEQRAAAEGENGRAERYQALIADREQQLAQIAEQILEFGIISDSETRARSLLFQAEDRLLNTRSQIDGATDEASLTIGETRALSPARSYVQAIGVFAVLGLVMAIALLAVVELVRPSPGRYSRRAEPMAGTGVRRRTSDLTGS